MYRVVALMVSWSTVVAASPSGGGAANGKGESAPAASNKSESGRQANRRVEILVEPVRAEG